MQTLMFLGAAHMQMPPIEYARNHGYRIITVDYKPDNPGHQLADRWYDCSTTNLKGVLRIAESEDIDGIVAYASDPAAPTAAYVGNQLGLPSNPYESVLTLAHKNRFRHFLAENGFNTPIAKSFTDKSEAEIFFVSLNTSAFIKPIDSSGSKGVTKISKLSELNDAFDHALKYSLSNQVLIENAIERNGYQIDSDIFLKNGKLAFTCWGDQHQDPSCHPYVPIGISFPSLLSERQIQNAESQIQSVLSLLGFEEGPFNVEFIIDQHDDVWLIEIGPRNGGNRIPDVIKYATGVDLVAATVESALGNDYKLPLNSEVNGNWSSYIVHSTKDGTYQNLNLSNDIKEMIIEEDIWKRQGDELRKFQGSNDTVGTMILRFPSHEAMCQIMDDMNRYISIESI